MWGDPLSSKPRGSNVSSIEGRRVDLATALHSESDLGMRHATPTPTPAPPTSRGGEPDSARVVLFCVLHLTVLSPKQPRRRHSFRSGPMRCQQYPSFAFNPGYLSQKYARLSGESPKPTDALNWGIPTVKNWGLGLGMLACELIIPDGETAGSEATHSAVAGGQRNLNRYEFCAPIFV